MRNTLITSFIFDLLSKPGRWFIQRVVFCARMAPGWHCAAQQGFLGKDGSVARIQVTHQVFAEVLMASAAPTMIINSLVISSWRARLYRNVRVLNIWSAFSVARIVAIFRAAFSLVAALI